MSEMDLEEVADTMLSGFEPIVDVVSDVVPFPVNIAVEFLWGGIKELVKALIFGV